MIENWSSLKFTNSLFGFSCPQNKITFFFLELFIIMPGVLLLSLLLLETHMKGKPGLICCGFYIHQGNKWHKGPQEN